MSPEPSRVPSLRDQVYERLRSRIMDLELPPGHRIVERDTAAELGVSRVPLREALRLLEAEGLIVVVPRQGAMVVSWSREDVVRLFEVREELETLAARLAAARRTDSDLRLMRGLLEEAERALDAGDEAATAAANAGFHRAVLAACGNPLLQQMMAPLDSRVQWLFHLTKHRDTREQRQEHVRLLELIEAGDGAGAAELYRAHIAAGLEPTLAVAETWERFDPVDVTRTRTRNRK
ncbi:GntR family transcriptional regulator [Nocardiopsis ganjiahuensis]|uniref:GntR family transcriptional regulator n=1 Tax=Nocardiopsis ganjiahuensis TaxID=239984 RepID=UPI000372B43A|nr:GntR family transcriptional regulator [Nocardiopsis ganjiahuensis]